MRFCGDCGTELTGDGHVCDAPAPLAREQGAYSRYGAPAEPAQPAGEQPTGSEHPTGEQPAGDQPAGVQPTGDQPAPYGRYASAPAASSPAADYWGTPAPAAVPPAADYWSSGYDLPTQATRSSDVLASGPRGGRTSGRRRGAVIGAALLTLGVAGGAVYGATALSGGGAQPEDVLPADAIGFLKVDMDPAAGQKIAVYQLARKFPDSGVTSEADVKDQLIRNVLPEDERADYDANVKPWLGQRAGLAVLPPAGRGSADPVAVAAVQYTDRAQAEEGLRRLAAEADDDFRYAFAQDEDYVLIGDDQKVVDRAATSTTHLADDPEFDRGVAALGGDQIAMGWLDVGALWQALPEEARRQQPGAPRFEPSGLAVVGAHVADGTVEVVGQTVGFSAGASPEAKALLSSPMGSTAPRGLLTALPADTVAAFGMTGLGDGLAQLYDAVPSDVRDSPEAQSTLREFGVRLPDDLRVVLGRELAVGVAADAARPQPSATVRVDSPDGARAVELLTRLRASAAQHAPAEVGEIDLRVVDGGYTATYGTSAPATPGRLGDSAVFRRTVPDADTAGLTYYVDIERLRRTPLGTDTALTDKQRRNLDPVQAVGLTSTTRGGGDSTLRFRLAVRD